jgi:hypothetical protein
MHRLIFETHYNSVQHGWVLTNIGSRMIHSENGDYKICHSGASKSTF